MPQRWKQPPWVGLRLTPAFLDSSRSPSHRRVELQLYPRTTSLLDAWSLETTPVGRASPDARVPGFVDAPKPSPRRAVARPTNNVTTGCLVAGNNPRGSGSARRPRSWTHRRAQAIAASSGSSTHEQRRYWMPGRWKQPPWVGLRPTPAFLDSSKSPSHRRVELQLDPRTTSLLDAWSLETTPVGRAPLDARVPGLIEEPKPSPRRAAARPTNDVATGCLVAGNNPRGSGSARRPRSWTHRRAQAIAASSGSSTHDQRRHWMPGP